MKARTSDVKIEFIRTNDDGKSFFKLCIGSFVRFSVIGSTMRERESILRFMIKEFNEKASMYQKVILTLSHIRMPNGTKVNKGYRWDLNMWETEMKFFGIKYYVYSIFGSKDKRSVFVPKNSKTRNIAYGPTGNRIETI